MDDDVVSIAESSNGLDFLEGSPFNNIDENAVILSPQRQPPKRANRNANNEVWVVGNSMSVSRLKIFEESCNTLPVISPNTADKKSLPRRPTSRTQRRRNPSQSVKQAEASFSQLSRRSKPLNSSVAESTDSLGANSLRESGSIPRPPSASSSLATQQSQCAPPVNEAGAELRCQEKRNGNAALAPPPAQPQQSASVTFRPRGTAGYSRMRVAPASLDGGGGTGGAIATSVPRPPVRPSNRRPWEQRAEQVKVPRPRDLPRVKKNSTDGLTTSPTTSDSSEPGTPPGLSSNVVPRATAAGASAAAAAAEAPFAPTSTAADSLPVTDRSSGRQSAAYTPTHHSPRDSATAGFQAGHTSPVLESPSVATTPVADATDSQRDARRAYVANSSITSASSGASTEARRRHLPSGSAATSPVPAAPPVGESTSVKANAPPHSNETDPSRGKTSSTYSSGSRDDEHSLAVYSVFQTPAEGVLQSTLCTTSPTLPVANAHNSSDDQSSVEPPSLSASVGDTAASAPLTVLRVQSPPAARDTRGQPTTAAESVAAHWRADHLQPTSFTPQSQPLRSPAEEKTRAATETRRPSRSDLSLPPLGGPAAFGANAPPLLPVQGFDGANPLKGRHARHRHPSTGQPKRAQDSSDSSNRTPGNAGVGYMPMSPVGGVPPSSSKNLRLVPQLPPLSSSRPEERRVPTAAANAPSDTRESRRHAPVMARQPANDQSADAVPRNALIPQAPALGTSAQAAGRGVPAPARKTRHRTREGHALRELGGHSSASHHHPRSLQDSRYPYNSEDSERILESSVARRLISPQERSFGLDGSPGLFPLSDTGSAEDNSPVQDARRNGQGGYPSPYARPVQSATNASPELSDASSLFNYVTAEQTVQTNSSDSSNYSYDEHTPAKVCYRNASPY